MRDGPAEVDVKTAGQVVGAPAQRLPAQPAEELDELPAVHVLVQPQLAGQVGDVPPGGDAVVPAVAAGDGRVAGGRA
jgi:hypothetical protein